MIRTLGPVAQGLLGTLFTWFVTALGAAVVFLVPSSLTFDQEGKLLDFALGFAGGVMLAASFWSLLDPALELAEESWGETWSFVPIAFGFVGGAAFVFMSDVLLPDADKIESEDLDSPEPAAVTKANNKGMKQRTKRKNSARKPSTSPSRKSRGNAQNKVSNTSVRRIMLLLIAVVLHNFPEGLAVGVAFGGINSTKGATFDKALSVAIGIGLQNFPEGLAVSLPLRRLGWSRSKAFFYGQLSGMVEPLGGLLGAGAVQLAQPILPYALAFAAGAMVYVVVDSVAPESHARGNGPLASWGAMVGFVVMMALDVALG